MLMTLKASRRNPWTHALLAANEEVGWIESRSIGLAGYADRAECRRAAELAARVLADWHKVRLQQRPTPWPEQVPAADQVDVGGIVVGRIVHPGVAPAGPGDTYGLEFAVPPEIWLAVRVQLAQRIYLALFAEGALPGSTLEPAGEPA